MHETHECNQNDTNRFISLNRLKNSALFIFEILLGILRSNCQYVLLDTENFRVPRQGITKFSIHLAFIEVKESTAEVTLEILGIYEKVGNHFIQLEWENSGRHSLETI